MSVKWFLAAALSAGILLAVMAGCAISAGPGSQATPQDYATETNAYIDCLMNCGNILAHVIPDDVSTNKSLSMNSNIITNGYGGYANLTLILTEASNANGTSIDENINAGFNNYMFNSSFMSVNGTFSLTISEVSNISTNNITVASTANITWNSTPVSWNLTETMNFGGQNLWVQGSINGRPVNTNIICLPISF